MHLAGRLRRAPVGVPASLPQSSPRPSRRRARPRVQRGQSLVEFAIALPIMLFLTLIALDFGRVYLGWINLQSMSRIAANYAANHPDANWGSASDPDVITYQNLVRADALATNCSLPLVAGLATAPTPTFTDVNGDGKRGIGDTAEVRLTCQFGVITPGISRVVGSQVAVSASSVFPIKAGMTATGGSGGGSGSAPGAAFSGNGVFSPSSLTGVLPFTVDFRDTSGGLPTSWLWDFKDGTATATAQDPPDHVFASPGTYIVTMTATNSQGSSTATMGVTVVAASTVDFTANQTSGNAPLAVTFTQNSSPGGTAYAWTFGTGEGSGSAPTANHTYNTAGSYTVGLTVTYPSGAVTQTKTNFIVVAPKQCIVPSFATRKRNTASGLWTGAGFTGTLTDGPGAPNGNGWTMTTQTLTALSSVPCTANIQVNDH